MKSLSAPFPSRPGSRRREKGVSLLEILMAMLFLGLAVTPIIGIFSQNYGLASRRIDHEIALKLAEATLNTLSAVGFSTLRAPPGAGFPLTLHFEVPGTPIPDVIFNIIGGTVPNETAKGAVIIKIGKNDFDIKASVMRVFDAAPVGMSIPVPPHPFLVFNYKVSADDSMLIPAATETRQYVCPDEFLMLSVHVSFLSGKETKTFSVTTCKANLNR